MKNPRVGRDIKLRKGCAPVNKEKCFYESSETHDMIICTCDGELCNKGSIQHMSVYRNLYGKSEVEYPYLFAFLTLGTPLTCFTTQIIDNNSFVTTKTHGESLASKANNRTFLTTNTHGQ